MEYSFLYPFEGGFAKVGVWDNDRMKWGLIDRNGKSIIEPVWDECIYDGDGLIRVCRGVNLDGLEVGPAYYPTDSGIWAVLDTAGKVVIPFQYTQIRAFRYGYAVVELHGNGFGMIDTTGELVLPICYDSLSNCNKYGFIIAHENGKDGIINLKGETLVPFEYDFIHPAATYCTPDDPIPVSKDGETFYITLSGERVAMVDL